MKISELHIENIKRIKIVDIKTDGKNVVIVEGRNAQGKSSTIDSIAYALGGEKLIPDEVIRRGEENAVIKMKLEEFEKTSGEVQQTLEARRDGFLITRNWTSPQRSYLKVEDEKGMSPGAPQTWVDERIGKISFDPMKFLAMQKEERIRELKKITGLDLSEIEKEYQAAYEKRREVKKEADRIRKELMAYADLAEPEATKNREDVFREMNRINNLNDETRKAKRDIEFTLESVKSAEKAIIEAEEEIARLMGKIGDQKSRLIKLNESTEKLRPVAEKEIVSVDHLQKELERIENAKVILSKLERKAQLESQVAIEEKSVSAAEKTVSGILARKDEVVKNAVMPIEGLAFDENSVRFNGIEMEQLASSEQVKVSMAIAMAQDPKIRVVLIHDGSLLDDGSMVEITRIAEEKDFQLWIERKAEGKGSAVYIEDGEVK